MKSYNKEECKNYTLVAENPNKSANKYYKTVILKEHDIFVSIV